MNKKLDRELCIILTLSIALNIGLALKLHAFNVTLGTNSQQSLKIGSHVSNLEAYDLAGHQKEIALSGTGKTSVLYVFSPTCHWCGRNLDNIKRLYSIQHANVKFIGISISQIGVSQYVSQTQFPLEVAVEPSAKGIEELHLGETPETIVVDPSGTVRQIWTGAYTEGICQEIGKFFGIPASALTPIT